MATSDNRPDETESQRREKRIQWTMRYCQHYDPDTLIGRGMGGFSKATRLCKAGVSYDSMTPGDRPCIDGHNKPNPVALCPKWLRKTREQGVVRADAIEASMNRMLVVMPVVAEWRKKLPKGKAEVIECPLCKGRLHLSQAACNGHVHGKCETEGCVSWME